MIKTTIIKLLSRLIANFLIRYLVKKIHVSYFPAAYEHSVNIQE